MTRILLWRAPAKSHRTRTTLIAIGTTVGVAEGLRRWRHRHHEGPAAGPTET
jgi:hypothetical protein